MSALHAPLHFEYVFNPNEYWTDTLRPIKTSCDHAIKYAHAYHQEYEVLNNQSRNYTHVFDDIKYTLIAAGPARAGGGAYGL